MVANEAASETVWLVAKQQSKYWKNVDPKACDAREGIVYISLDRNLPVSWCLTELHCRAGTYIILDPR